MAIHTTSHFQPFELAPKASASGHTGLSPADFLGVHSQKHHDSGKHAALHPTASSRHNGLVDQTRKWVSQTFFGTLMKQMRKSPFKSELFSGGRGGEMFGELYDQQMVDHMAKGTGGKLVKSIVDRIEHPENHQAGHRFVRGGATAPATRIGALPTPLRAATAADAYRRQSTLSSGKQVVNVRPYVAPGIGA